jgi:hypothetical protein
MRNLTEVLRFHFATLRQLELRCLVRDVLAYERNGFSLIGSGGEFLGKRRAPFATTAVVG